MTNYLAVINRALANVFGSADESRPLELPTEDEEVTKIFGRPDAKVFYYYGGVFTGYTYDSAQGPLTEPQMAALRRQALRDCPRLVGQCTSPTSVSVSYVRPTLPAVSSELVSALMRGLG